MDKGRTCTRWFGGVKKACNARLLELSDAKVMCIEREQCRDFVKGTNGGLNVKIITNDTLHAKP